MGTGRWLRHAFTAVVRGSLSFLFLCSSHPAPCSLTQFDMSSRHSFFLAVVICKIRPAFSEDKHHLHDP